MPAPASPQDLAGVDWINAAIDSRYVTVESFPFGSRPVQGSAGGRADPAIVACYECGLPASVYRKIAERYSCGGLQRAAAAQRIMPTTAITASIAGAQAVNLALRLPRLIHEQNGVLGRVNRWFAPKAGVVACGVWPTEVPAGAKAVHVGNPVRSAVLAPLLTT